MTRLTNSEIRAHARDAAEESVGLSADEERAFYVQALQIEDPDQAEEVSLLAAEATFRAVLPGDVDAVTWLRARAAAYARSADLMRTADCPDDAHDALAMATELWLCADDLEAS